LKAYSPLNRLWSTCQVSSVDWIIWARNKWRFWAAQP
jgi:hypothetical protein